MVAWLDHEGPGAIPTKCADQAERIVRPKAQVVGNDTSRLPLGEESIEEGPHDTVTESIRRHRQGERQERRAAGKAIKGLRNVVEPEQTPFGSDRGHPEAVDPDRQMIGRYQSSFWRVTRTPSSLRMATIRRNCLVSLPFSRWDRYEGEIPTRSAS